MQRMNEREMGEFTDPLAVSVWVGDSYAPNVCE